MTKRRDDLDFILAHRARRKKRSARLRRRQQAGIAAILLVLLAVGAAASTGAGIAFSAGCDLNALQPVEIGQNSFVYADDGSLLGTIPAERNREPVPMSAMTPWLAKATVAIEDRRFYEHGGVDYLGIARAAWTDVTAGKVVQGGSTITQQLVRNLYTGQERTFNRKVKEACLAIKLSRKWSKTKILNDYLNTVYYGNHAYGVEAAAQTYFSEHAQGSDAAPGRADRRPAAGAVDLRPASTTRRRRCSGATRCCRRCSERRSSRRPPTTQAILVRSLDLKPGNVYTHITQPYFFSYVIDQLEQQYGANTVREGGLQVYTTIDPRLQYLAKKAINDVLPYKTDPAAAVVSVEPGTGAIRAMTAVVRTKGNQFNLVAQSTRQAGSTFKTFVLAAAIEKGIDPDSTYYVSAPFTCTVGPWCSPNDPWQVHTYGNTLSRQRVGDAGDALLGQHRVRPADARRRPEERLGDGAPAGRADVARPSVRVDRARLARRRPAGHGGGLRDVPDARGLREAAGDREGRAAGRQGRLELGQAGDQARALAGRRVEGDRRAPPERPVRDGRRLRRTGSTTTRARPGRPRTTRTRGSTATPASCRRLSGWATRRARSRCSASTARRLPGATFDVPIWHEYMAAALKHRPALAFALPKKYPTFEYLKKGDFGSLAYAPTTTLNITTPITGGAPPGAGPH